MRILPRIARPTLKPFRKTVRWSRQNLSVWRLVLLVEGLLFLAVCVFVFTGGRRVAIDSWGGRSDLVVTFLLMIAFVLFHCLVKKYVLPRIERHFSPAHYEERQVLFSLGQEARSASSIDELFAAISKHIGDSFETENVSILICDELSGDYVSVVSSSRAGSATAQESESLISLSCNAFVVKRLRNLSAPLLIDSAELEVWGRAMEAGPASTRLARQQEREALRQLKSRLLVQIRTKDQMMGILSLGSRRRKQFRYSADDKELVKAVAGQLALIIENTRLAQRMVAQERLTRELTLAVEVQQRLLPAKATDDLALELAGFCEPARGVGGDYYDFIAHEDQQLGIAIADVSGKGLPAALLMSTVQATLRSLAARNGGSGETPRTLAETVGTLNKLLCDATGGANYVTFFYAQFDPATNRLAYVNAGHNPPLYLRAGAVDEFTALSSGGLIVGIFRDSTYEQAVIETMPGDLLFAYTDGLTEALNRDGEEFGETRVRQILTDNAGRSVDEIREELVRCVREWSKGTPQYDDLTFVIMKVPEETRVAATDQTHTVDYPLPLNELELLTCGA